MARTYTKKTKMNTITEFSDLLSAEEMEFFPSLDLSLPEFGDDIDDVLQRNTPPKNSSQEFSADDILQELNFKGGDKLLETDDWFTQKFDFSGFDPSFASTSETLQDFSQVDGTEFGISLDDLNDTFLTEPIGEEQLSIPIEMPTTPEQKVPEYAAVSPYSIYSADSPVCMSDSSELSPCSPTSSSDSTVCLTDLLTSDSGSNASPSPSKQVESQSNASTRVTPYFRNAPKTNTKPKGKTPAQRQRKRVQNKDAATRYRVKKRSELDILFDEAEQAEKDNSDLRDQVSSIGKEIEYLKNLMLEVYKTKKKREQAASLKVA